MPISMYPVALFAALVWGVVASGMLYYFWRKSSNLYALLMEGASRYDELRQLNRSLEASLQNADKKMGGHRQEVSRLQEDLASSRQHVRDINETLTAKELELKTVREKLEGQKRYLEHELEKAHATVSRTMQQNQEESTKAASLDREVHTLKTNYEKQLATLMANLKSKETSYNSLEEKFKKVDPNEVIKVKRKAHNYERLYQSMKGLREMSDERNRNWEVALRKLSLWILSESGVSEKKIPEAIGPLVGQALQVTGHGLVDDSEEDQEMFAAPQGATATDTTTDHA